MSRTEIKSLGEFKLIEHLTEHFAIQHKSTVTGIGDDAAVISNNADELLCVTTDLLLEGIHFDLSYTPLKHLGYKAVTVNVSDICAMNAIPKQITVSIGISNRFSVEALEELYSGIQAACDHYHIDLIGGDTSSSLQGLIISITAIGTQLKEKIVYRNSAKAGDILCVTGDLGSAYLGLQILEREKQVFLADPNFKPELEKHTSLIQKILKPEARIDTVRMLGQANIIPTSMIDISDGLSSDLMHICTQSKVGAVIEEEWVPMHLDAKLQAIEFKIDPITCALNGGEDYEILFTVNSADAEKVRFLPGIYIIGEIVNQSNGVKLKTTGGNFHPILAQGWQHLQ